MHLAGAVIQQKLAEEKPQRSKAYLAEAQKLAHMGSWVLRSPHRQGALLRGNVPNFRIGSAGEFTSSRKFSAFRPRAGAQLYSAAPLKSIDQEMLAGHEHMRLDGQIAHDASDILRRADPSHGNTCG
jgi:hypothetical protein